MYKWAYKNPGLGLIGCELCTTEQTHKHLEVCILLSPGVSLNYSVEIRLWFNFIKYRLVIVQHKTSHDCTVYGSFIFRC